MTKASCQKSAIGEKVLNIFVVMLAIINPANTVVVMSIFFLLLFLLLLLLL